MYLGKKEYLHIVPNELVKKFIRNIYYKDKKRTISSINCQIIKMMNFVKQDCVSIYQKEMQ